MKLERQKEAKSDLCLLRKKEWSLLTLTCRLPRQEGTSFSRGLANALSGDFEMYMVSEMAFPGF